MIRFSSRKIRQISYIRPKIRAVIWFLAGQSVRYQAGYQIQVLVHAGYPDRHQSGRISGCWISGLFILCVLGYHLGPHEHEANKVQRAGNCGVNYKDRIQTFYISLNLTRPVK